MAATVAVLIIAAAAVVVLIGHRGKASHNPQAGADSPSARTSSPVARGTPTLPGHSGVVTIEPAAAIAPQEAKVAAFLNRYFSAINKHDYSAYLKLFSQPLSGALSAAAFSSGYGTTTDSAVTLRGIEVVGASQVRALVSFTSHQQAAASQTQSSCTAWRISLYLIKHGHRYLLQAPPSGYQASYHPCT